MTADNRLFYKLNLSQRMLSKRVDSETMDRLGVRSSQLAALFYLLKNDGCFLKDLSEELFQNKSAITTLVERMEKKGLLRKKKSKVDGRAFQVFITSKGRSIGLQGLELLPGFNEKLTAGFSLEEMAVIHRFLDYIIQALHNKSD